MQTHISAFICNHKEGCTYWLTDRMKLNEKEKGSINHLLTFFLKIIVKIFSEINFWRAEILVWHIRMKQFALLPQKYLYL